MALLLLLSRNKKEKNLVVSQSYKEKIGREGELSHSELIGSG